MAKKVIQAKSRSKATAHKVVPPSFLSRSELHKALRPQRQWYEYITPLAGIKWGATVTLVGYAWQLHPQNDGLRLAAIIVTIFLALEWTQMAWCEYRRGR